MLALLNLFKKRILVIVEFRKGYNNYLVVNKQYSNKL